MSGADLGYEVQPFNQEAGQTAGPDFTGYPLRFVQPGTSYMIQIVAPDGQVLPNSQRLVRVPAERGLAELMLLAMVPFLIGAAVIIRRTRRQRLPRNIAG